VSEVVEGLRESARELAGLTSRLGTAHPAEGWSAAEVLGHLAHFEVLAGARIRMVLTKDKPQLAAFDQEEFNRRFGDLLSPAAALALFEVNRAANCELLSRLEPGDWERWGVHPMRGEETLATTVAMLLRHDREHLEQLRAAL